MRLARTFLDGLQVGIRSLHRNTLLLREIFPVNTGRQYHRHFGTFFAWSLLFEAGVCATSVAADAFRSGIDRENECVEALLEKPATDFLGSGVVAEVSIRLL